MRSSGVVGLLLSWLRGPDPRETDREPPDTPAPRKPPRCAVPVEYQSLHKYLDDRYADTVILTFGEIEDLLGFKLPDLARVGHEWWANADTESAPSAQSCSWIQASRTASPNLRAQTVVFERA